MPYNNIMFICVGCKVLKPIEEFSKSNNRVGHRHKCRTCWNEYMKEYYKKNPSKYNDQKKYVKVNDAFRHHSYNRHGLTETEFLTMYNRFDGKCWSCKDSDITCIDHDHKCCNHRNSSCGKCIRGLLCNGCNTALGMLRDSTERIESLLEYLQSS